MSQRRAHYIMLVGGAACGLLASAAWAESLDPNPAAPPLASHAVQVTGGYRLNAGMTRDDFILRDANADDSERNFRIISPDFLQENTYDPAIYSRLWFDVDAAPSDDWHLHSKVVIDPWSFTGTTDEVTVVRSNAADQVALRLKYWGSTHRTINETYWTENVGDQVTLPEIEVDDGHTVGTQVKSNLGSTYNLPEMEIDETFQPVREVWLDYATDTTRLRVFPVAYEDQALSSDDPLELSNHRSYWQSSPWTDEWLPGHRLERKTAPVVNAFLRGEWSSDLASFTRDSDLQYLTALRGATLLWHPSDAASLQAGMASPKTLWQDYESWDSFVGMVRPKYRLHERLTLGGIYTTRWAYNERVLDAYNHVWGLDAAFTPADRVTWTAEAVKSFSASDSTLLSKYNFGGWAWQTAIEWGGPKDTADAAAPIRVRMHYTHMDEAFDPGLSTYHETRDDTFWSRHLSFYRPLPGYRTAHDLQGAGALSPDELSRFRIGDGVDTGRDVIGARLTSRLFDGRWESIYDYRNIHDVNGKFMEGVARIEQTWRPTPRFTSRCLALYHQLHDTMNGTDDVTTLLTIVNTEVPDGQTASVLTLAAGLEYALLDQLSAWAAWEVSQDESRSGSDHYPRRLFNNVDLLATTIGDQRFRFDRNALYNQGAFPRAPYPWAHIFKLGSHWEPSESLIANVSWTRNTYEFAGQIDQNMNHMNVEVEYHPYRRWMFLGRYTWSAAFDLPRVESTGGADIEYARHNNLYLRALYRVTDRSAVSCEFGVGAFVRPDRLGTVDPVGEQYPVLDTQMIVRLAYTAAF